MATASFSEWYRESQPGLLESVLRVVGRQEVAEDALDEAFEKAFARWQRVQAMRSPSGWVYRVAVNAARRQLAREVREGERLGFATAGRSVVPPPGGEAWLLVGELPVRQRTAIVLRHVAAMTEVEIAAAMGVTRSTVSSTLASAYRSLAAVLSEPSTSSEVVPMTLSLALAISCDLTGAEIEHMADGTRRRAAWSDAVRDTIKVRPGDLVAVDDSVIVWRWWGGTVVEIDGNHAVVERNATRREPGDPRTVRIEVEVPGDLELETGDRVWFGSEEERKVVVAAGGPETVISRVTPRLPDVSRALDG
jgi:DNA-directed RNA polymerase specialized sigma24 family protein